MRLGNQVAVAYFFFFSSVVKVYQITVHAPDAWIGRRWRIAASPLPQLGVCLLAAPRSCWQVPACTDQDMYTDLLSGYQINYKPLNLATLSSTNCRCSHKRWAWRKSVPSGTSPPPSVAWDSAKKLTKTTSCWSSRVDRYAIQAVLPRTSTFTQRRCRLVMSLKIHKGREDDGQRVPNTCSRNQT